MVFDYADIPNLELCQASYTTTTCQFRSKQEIIELYIQLCIMMEERRFGHNQKGRRSNTVH